LDTVAPGDTVLVVTDTDPRTVLCGFIWIVLLDGRHTIADKTYDRDRPLQSLTKVEDAVGISLAGDRVLNPRTARALVTAISGSCTLCHDRVVIASEQDVTASSTTPRWPRCSPAPTGRRCCVRTAPRR